MTSYSALSDQQLTVLLKDGDEYAYTEIYTRYWPLLFRHSRKMLYDDEQAMDVVQDIFTSLWFNHVALELNTSLSAYLYTSVRNWTINVINKGKLQVVSMESLQEYLSKGAYVTDETVRFNELASEIEAEIAKLPPKMREIFELRGTAGLSYKQIAAHLNIAMKR